MERFEKLQSSLPFNLDEAAEEYAPDFSNSIASKAAVDAIREAFKAGAQWQKQQNDLKGKEMDSTDSFIEKACKWLKENAYFYVNDFTGSLNDNMLVNEFHKAMKE